MSKDFLTRYNEELEKMKSGMTKVAYDDGTNYGPWIIVGYYVILFGGLAWGILGDMIIMTRIFGVLLAIQVFGYVWKGIKKVEAWFHKQEEILKKK